ncbi:MAG: hypothetical protein ACLTZT_12690 [Butyricimonas faecalis]
MWLDILSVVLSLYQARRVALGLILVLHPNFKTWVEAAMIYAFVKYYFVEEDL